MVLGVSQLYVDAHYNDLVKIGLSVLFRQFVSCCILGLAFFLTFSLFFCFVSFWSDVLFL